MTEHRNLTGDNLHEPKGVETATSGQVYVANGTGSGSWRNILADILNLNKLLLAETIWDVSQAGANFYKVAPAKVKLNKITVILSGPITTANVTLTVYRNNIATNASVSVPTTGSGRGVVTSATANVDFNENDIIEVRSDGASDTAANADVTLSLTVVT